MDSDTPAPITHQDLVNRAVRWLRNTQKCSVVFYEQVAAFTEAPDAIGWQTWTSTLVECKISRSDFYRDRSKIQRRLPELGMGCHRYYLCPKGLISRHEIPAGWGLLYAHNRYIEVVVKASANLRTPDGQRREISFLVSALRRVQIRLGDMPLEEFVRWSNNGEAMQHAGQLVQEQRSGGPQ